MNIENEINNLKGLSAAAFKKANTANERIDALPLPMVFKGTLGTGGTIESLPTASSANEGYVYIVITDGTYAGQSAKAGDTFVSDGSSWVLVPSGDEPSVIDDSVTSTALTWSSKKISDERKVKTLKYTGIGGATSTIEFPETPQYIFQIFGNADTGAFARLDGFPYGLGITTTSRILDGTTYSPTQKTAFITYDGNTMHVRSEDQYRALNVNGYEYTVYYI